MAEFRRCFHAIDVKNTGKITMEDLREYMKKMNYTEKFVSSWMKLFPFTEGGVITYEQYCKTLGLIPRKQERELVKPSVDVDTSLHTKDVPSAIQGETSRPPPIGTQGELEEQRSSLLASSKETKLLTVETNAPEDESLDTIERQSDKSEPFVIVSEQSPTQEVLYSELLIPRFHPIDMQVDTQLTWNRESLEIGLTDLSNPIEIPKVEPVTVPPYTADLTMIETAPPEVTVPFCGLQEVRDELDLFGVESKMFEPVFTEPSASTNIIDTVGMELESAEFRTPPAKHRMKGHKREHCEVDIEGDLDGSEQSDQSLRATEVIALGREKRKPRRGKKVLEITTDITEPHSEEHQVTELATKEDEILLAYEKDHTRKSASPESAKRERSRAKRSGSSTKSAQVPKQVGLPAEQPFSSESGVHQFDDSIFLKDPVATTSDTSIRTKGKKQKHKSTKRQNADEILGPDVIGQHRDESPLMEPDKDLGSYSIEMEVVPTDQQVALFSSPTEGYSLPSREENIPLLPTALDESEDTVEEQLDAIKDIQSAIRYPILLHLAESQQHQALDTHSVETTNDQEGLRKQKLKVIGKTNEVDPNIRNLKSLRIAPQLKVYSAPVRDSSMDIDTKVKLQDRTVDGAFAEVSSSKVESAKRTQLRQAKKLPEPPLLPKPSIPPPSSSVVSHEPERPSDKKVRKHKLKESLDILECKKRNKSVKAQQDATQKEHRKEHIQQASQSVRPKPIIQLARMRRRREAKAHQDVKDRTKERQTRFPRSFTVQPDPDLYRKRMRESQRQHDRLMERRLKNRFPNMEQISKKTKKKKAPSVLERWRLRPSLRGRGMIVILLAGIHRGKRVVCLGRHKSTGLLLVTGPFRHNGCPLRRVHPNMVIVTKTRIDLGKHFKLPSRVHSKEYFARSHANKRNPLADPNLLSQPMENHSVYKPNEARKEDQLIIDTAVCEAIKARDDSQMLIKYLKSLFSLGKHDKPHKMVF